MSHEKVNTTAFVAKENASLYEECLALRRKVFIEEQHVPEELEVDGLDEQCIHIAAMQCHADGTYTTIGTCRLRPLHFYLKLERAAVVKVRKFAFVL